MITLETLQTDLKAAMLNRDSLTTNVLRSVITAYKNEVVALRRGADGVLSQDEIITIIKRGVKSREDASAQFSAGGDDARAGRELLEIEVLKPYLPTMISNEVLAQEISAIKESGVTQVGAIMKALKEKFGQNFDAKVASGLAR